MKNVQFGTVPFCTSSERVDRLDYSLCLLTGDYRTDGKAQFLRMDALGNRQADIVPLTVALLLVRGYGIMDQSLYAVCLQVFLEFVPALAEYWELMPYV